MPKIFYKEDRVLEFNPFKTENNQILKNQNLLFSVFQSHRKIWLEWKLSFHDNQIW